MKKLLLLLPLLAIIYACDSGNGGGATGGNVDLTTVEDSMYYGFGSSVITGINIEGIPWVPASFEKGIRESQGGNASMDMQGAMNNMQIFGQEVQSRQGRPITDSDPLAANMDDVSYAYGVYLNQQLSDIGMEVKTDAFVGGFADAAAGINLLGSEAKLQEMVSQFNNAANTKARAVQEARGAAEAEPNKQAGAAFMEENKTKEGVQTHESGMQYKVLKEGDPAGVSPTVADKVVIHYEGRLLDGTIFDSSYKRGEPANFPLSNLIQGWQIALPMMKPGAKWTIWLPSDIAYGNAGSGSNIPPGATLEFDIEFFEIGN